MHALTRFDQLFGDPFLNLRHESMEADLWQPSVDIRETDDALEVFIEVPGVDPGQIDAFITGFTLTVKGEKSRELRKTDEQGRDRHIERSFGSFCRKIRLPAYVDSDTAQASIEQGVLKILLQKRDKPKRIDINLN